MLPQRKSPRLPEYDYAQSGAYFVTICTHQRTHLFGHIRDGVMHQNDLGEMVAFHWEDLLNHFPHIELDAYVVMPNHFHGIVVITDVVGTASMPSDLSGADAIDGVPTKKTPTLGVIVGTFKAAVTRRANRTMKHPPAIWQARYHDRIIRSEREYDIIRAYVLDNPARWGEDVFNKFR